MWRGFLKDISLYSLGDLATRLIQFVFFPILAYVFDVADFGVITLLLTVQVLGEILFGMGFHNALHRFFYDSSTDQKTLVTTGFAAMVIFGLLILSGIFLFTPVTPIVFLILFSSWLQKLFDYTLDILRMGLRAPLYTCLKGVQKILGMGIALVAIIIYNKGVLGYFQGICLGTALSLPFAFWAAVGAFHASLSIPLAKKMLHYGGPIAIGELGFWLLTSMDRWMLESMVGETSLGLYGIAFKISTIMILLANSFGLAWNPHSMKWFEEGDGESHKPFFATCFSLWSKFLLVVATALGFFAPEILHLCTPRPYWEAAPIVPLLAMGFVFYGISHIFLSAISISKRTHYITIALWLAVPFNALLNWILIPKYGVMGAASSSCLSYLALSIYYYWCSQTLHPLPIRTKEILQFSTAGLIALIAQYGLESFSLKLLFFIPFLFMMLPYRTLQRSVSV